MKSHIGISAIWLRRTGNGVEVLAEVDGDWRKVIAEHIDGSFSHIVEAIGIQRSPIDRAAT